MVMSEQRLGVPEWDERQVILNGFTQKICAIAPADCCIHSAPFCLSCSLEWLVDHCVPIFLFPVPVPKHDAA
jgi:hypothetical protein